jgi:hypothetical protein
VVGAAVDLAVGVRLLEGDDDGGVPAGEVVTGVGRETDLAVSDGVGNDVVAGALARRQTRPRADMRMVSPSP